MAWTYSADPTSSTRDEVRFLIQDTDSDDRQISDEELDYLLAEYGDDPGSAALAAVDQLMVKYARQVDYRLGMTAVSASQRFQNYKELKQKLTVRFGGIVVPVMPARNTADKRANAENLSLVKPAFTRDNDYLPQDFDTTDDRTL